MPFFGTRQAFESLSDDQRELVREKRLSATMTLPAWAELLDGIDAFDRKADSDRHTIGTLGAMLVVAGTAVMVLGAMRHMTALAWLAGVLGLCGVLLLLWKYFAERLDLPEKPRTFAREVVETLGSTLPAGAPVHLELDLGFGTREDTHQEQRSKREGFILFSETKRTTDDLWEQPLLAGSADLADGSRLVVRAVNRIRRTVEESRQPQVHMKGMGIGWVADGPGSRHRNRSGWSVEVRFQTESEIEVTLSMRGSHPSIAAGSGHTPNGDAWAVVVGPSGTQATVRRSSWAQGIHAPSRDDLNALLQEARRRLTPGVVVAG